MQVLVNAELYTLMYHDRSIAPV